MEHQVGYFLSLQAKEVDSYVDDETLLHFCWEATTEIKLS